MTAALPAARIEDLVGQKSAYDLDAVALVVALSGLIWIGTAKKWPKVGVRTS